MTMKGTPWDNTLYDESFAIEGMRRMKKQLILVSSLAIVVLAAVPVMAQQEEQQYASEEPASYEFVQGTITYVSPTHDQIRVEEEDGSLTDFEVPPETPISYTQEDARLLAPTPDDLEVGQGVEVAFYLPEGPEILIYPPRRTSDQIKIEIFIPPNV
jgi:hypothetical protein